MSRFLKNILVFTILVFPSFGYAEFYKYKKESGATVFTDDLSRVPADQRPDATRYEESLPHYDTKKHGQQEKDEFYSEPDDSTGFKESTKIDRIEEMNRKKAGMEKEYRHLLKEKAELENHHSEFESRDELNEYNEKIVNLNERISDYEKRRRAFSEEVDEFNARQDIPKVNDDEKINNHSQSGSL